MTDSELLPVAIESTKILFGAEELIEGEQMLLAFLEQKIRHMMENDFNSLVNLLYRIDVYESKAKNCFGKQNREIAKCLAGLVWERQLEKARRKGKQ